VKEEEIKSFHLLWSSARTTWCGSVARSVEELEENMDAALNWERVRIPESCRGVDIVVGVDEAGRGPVLGPLVYGAAFWPVSEDAAIQKMGLGKIYPLL
jgi:ribonuclease HIII